jgi:hypothetical protein
MTPLKLGAGMAGAVALLMAIAIRNIPAPEPARAMEAKLSSAMVALALMAGAP